MSASGSNSFQSGIGSILILDSSMSNVTNAGVLLRNDVQPKEDDVSGTLLLDNVIVDNVNYVIRGSDGSMIVTASGRQTISWGRGSVYKDDKEKGTFASDYLQPIKKSVKLLDKDGKFFQKSRPQYKDLTSSDFVSVLCKFRFFLDSTLSKSSIDLIFYSWWSSRKRNQR